jgi:hypothetical protein
VDGADPLSSFQEGYELDLAQDWQNWLEMRIGYEYYTGNLEDVKEKIRALSIDPD